MTLLDWVSCSLWWSRLVVRLRPRLVVLRHRRQRQRLVVRLRLRKVLSLGRPCRTSQRQVVLMVVMEQVAQVSLAMDLLIAILLVLVVDYDELMMNLVLTCFV